MSGPRQQAGGASLESGGRAPVQSSATGPLQRLWTSRKTKHIAKNAFELIAVTVGTMSVSYLLMRLSGSALWLPREWRYTQFLIPVFGLSVYTFARLGTQQFRAHWAGRKSAGKRGAAVVKARETAMARSRIVTAAIAAVTLLVVLQPVLAYNHLRESCVHNLQVPTLNDNRNWWWETFGDGTPMPAFDYDNRSAKQEMEIWLADHLDPRLPDFLDRRNSRIYVPLLPEHGESSPTCDWPREWIEQLCIRGQYAQHAHAGEPCHIAGLRDILMHDPVTLIDWLQVNGASSLRDTTARFFKMHITIIGLVAFAAGITFAPANMLARELAESIT